MNIEARILKIKAVAILLGISPSTIRRLERRGLFPRRVKFPGSVRTGWMATDITAYLEGLKVESQRQQLVHSTTWRAGKPNQSN